MNGQEGSYEALLVDVGLALTRRPVLCLSFPQKRPATEGPEQLILAQVVMDLYWLILFDEKIMKSASTCKVLTFVVYTVTSCAYTAAICVGII